MTRERCSRVIVFLTSSRQTIFRVIVTATSSRESFYRVIVTSTVTEEHQISIKNSQHSICRLFQKYVYQNKTTTMVLTA